MLAVTHHVKLPGFEVGVRTQTGVDAYAVEKVWLALLAELTEITPSKSLLPALAFRCEPADFKTTFAAAFRLKPEST